MRISIKFGNILDSNENAIVNTVNSALSAGYGLDGQIRKTAGISVECQLSRHNRCEPGNVVLTTAGKLRQEYIIHAVGPIWKGGNYDEEKILREVYYNCLLIAEKFNIKSIAFPNISTGIFNFPKEEAAQIALEVVNSFNTKSITEVVFFCFDTENFQIYKNKYKRHFY